MTDTGNVSGRTTAGRPTDTENVSGACPSVRSGQVRQTKSGQVSETSGLGLGTSLRAANGLQATTIALLILRPDWPEADTAAVLARDPRPWRAVVAAAFACALDPAIEHPSRIETTNPARVVADHGPTPTPPSYAEVRRRQAALEDAS